MNSPAAPTFEPSANPLDQAKWLPPLPQNSRIVVVGAGAFGGWTALWLQRHGFNVTLVDSWGAGHGRSSSGDETRVIRSTYGASQLYFDLNVMATSLWREFEKTVKQRIFFNSGVLWFCYDAHTPIVDASLPFASAHQQPYQYLAPEELSRRYPAISCEALHHAYFDPYGGYLVARDACRLVKNVFEQEGGQYYQGAVTPIINAEHLAEAHLADGTPLPADLYIYACGSWLKTLFPDILGDVIHCTRQEVYYFGMPATSSSINIGQLPVWVDVDGQDFYYGIPDPIRGFKIGVDRRGPHFDPTNDDRVINVDVLHHAREFMAKRFPAMANAPLIENRVCPYESTPDGNFVLDNHPQASNILLLGGGSGHGFKHGPALGKLVARIVSGEKSIPSAFLLSPSRIKR